LKINKTWEKRAEEESPHDVVFGKFQGNRLKRLLKNDDAKKLDKKSSEEVVMELNVKGNRVLDAGIGPLARFSSIFHDSGAQVTGIDISRKTLESARRALNGKPVNLVLADIMNLPFKSDSFNTAFCYGTLYHMPNGRLGIEKALKELARATKKNEIIVFNLENYLNPVNWPQILGRKILGKLGTNIPPHTFFNYMSLRRITEGRTGLRIIKIRTTFEFWGPFIFLPTPLLKSFVRIWIPVSKMLSEKSDNSFFLRFFGASWFLKVESI
jgi:SAM-dependent methyltransferase